ncbi:sensor histidine kinase [Piscinibacter sp.]|uniref:sensor histidine kinase n=1 Tax=Piscinibacter sp. TaxID=1903157 RepID=UPI002B908D38|nr:sensor histidine kinase N-terminal domain-containing protein [Albitalea sp.]HUG24467.1 sensor histidine kinase N-terminal domain-containing protein [Albitalea sp.]
MLRLRSLLLRWLLIPSLLLWAGGFALGYWRSLAQAHEAFDRTLLGSALVLGEHLVIAGGEVVADLPHAALEMLRTDAQDRVYYRVSSLDSGRYVTGYEDLPPPPDPWSGEPSFYDADYKGQAVRIVALRRTLLDGSDRRRLLVQVAETLDARHALTRRLVQQSALVQLLLISAAAGLIVLGVRHGLAPLRQLRDEVRARDPDDLRPIATADVPREVAPLIEAINVHTERQRQLGEAQLRFVANASHQLKTPLTLLRALSGQAQLQADAGQVRAVLARLDETTDTTARIVGQLLTLARAEPGHVLQHATADLTLLAHDATFELLGAAGEKSIDLGFEGHEALPVRGDPVLLRELVTNLVHNAITYTPAGGRVTVTVGRRDGRPVLSVVDNGPGIPESEREQVFERFYRVAGNPAQGSGLGLAIVKEICARHGITIVLGDAPGGGTGLRVALSWPSN